MRHSMKVAKWEVKRNVKNKSFLISLFLTPFIFIAVSIFINWLNVNPEEALTEPDITVYVHDELGIFPKLKETASELDLPWKLIETEQSESSIQDKLEGKSAAYIKVNETALSEGIIPVHTGDELGGRFTSQLALLQGPILAYQMDDIGLSPDQAATLSRGVHFIEMNSAEAANEETEAGIADTEEDFLAKLVPAGFAAIIFLTVIFTGMAIFQSASQEKKDKIAEILLSSLTPGQLMQGKIIGYFILGLIQTTVLLVFLIPYIIMQTDIPLIEYLFVPETVLFVALAVLNYLMFAAILVGIGATIEDVTTAGNFQGIIMMLPFLPVIFIGPVFSDPSGIMAQIGTYIPFTAPGVLLMRLAILDVWPWLEIIISLIVILISIVLFIKLAGKIFKVGILMYGKNATPAEIWKWIKAS